MKHLLTLQLVICLLVLPGARAQAAAIQGDDYGSLDEGQKKAIQNCLKEWPNHPFKVVEQTRIRLLQSTVKVMGIGKNVRDVQSTETPQLVLIHPAVNVLSKSEYELMNPNGWYCFKTQVTVLAKSVIKAHCNAHVATGKGDTSVLGSGEERQGVTVLGKINVERIHCK